MNKGLKFLLLLCAYVLGAVGGFGYAMHNKAYLIGVSVILLSLMAFPTVKKAWREYQDE